MIDPVVVTCSGRVRGSEVHDGILAWHGIPYAAPPTGDLRWRLPQPADTWAGIRDALDYGAPALQPGLGLAAAPGPVRPGMSPPAAIPEPSEDCLFLNITAPADADRLPVVVWIHGGGYQLGHGAQGPGDGAQFAAVHRVVVVSFNYRLGALGFLAVAGETYTGSYGLHDQIAALRWVHANIAAFGGDPTRITITGVSAGAKSVANLLASPMTTGLFIGALSASGGADHVATTDQDTRLRRRYLDQLGAPGASAGSLRSVPAADLLAAQAALADGLRGTWIWRPSIDGLALDRPPLDAIRAGSAKAVHLLVQHCRLEGLLYELFAPGAADETDRVLTELFGPDDAEAILTGYASARPDLADDPHRLRLEIFSDERYAVASTRLADAQSLHGTVWRSRFDGPLRDYPLPGLMSGPMPATHNGDVAGLWFGTGPCGTELFTAAGALVTTGSPETTALPHWPAYDDTHRPTMIFHTDKSHLEHDPDRAQQQIWDDRIWPSDTWWPIPEP